MAVRCGALSLGAQGNSYLEPGEWQASLAYRWLHSDRHFVGGEEQPRRQADGSEVVNDIHTFDLSLARAFTPHLSLSLTLPFVHADRSSLYEHDRTNRHHMQAGGLADVRLVGTAWLLDPPTHPNGNFALGAGIKAPTGDYEATDYKFRPSGPVLDYVDSSIQPGDGGWGVILEAQGFQKVFKNTFAYLSIPHERWKVVVFTPRLEGPVQESTGGNFVWRSFSRSGHILSMFVEKPATGGRTHDDCFNYYWPRASRNPLIDPQSVQVEHGNRYTRVTYRSSDIRNAIYYFCFKDRWVDLHLSQPLFNEVEKMNLADFESRFRYGEE